MRLTFMQYQVYRRVDLALQGFAALNLIEPHMLGCADKIICIDVITAKTKSRQRITYRTQYDPAFVSGVLFQILTKFNCRIVSYFYESLTRP